MKPTLLIKGREEAISEKEDSIIEIDKKSKLAIFSEIISVEPLDKIDQVTQTKSITLHIQKSKFSILRDDSFESVKLSDKSTPTLEKEKFEEKDKDTLEKPSKTSRSERKRRDRKSDGLINITPRKTDKKNIILTPSLGEVCLEISGKVDKEKEIRSSLNEMVQTGSDLGEPPSSDNESEQKADEKDKEKLISIQEGVYDAKFSIIQNDDFTFEIIGGKIKEVESEKKIKLLKEEKIPKVSEEEKKTKEITSKPKDILPKKDEIDE